MTREEYEIVKTRNYLRAIKEAMKTGKIESHDEWFEAIDKAIEVFNEKREAIKALEQEPCEDAISRKSIKQKLQEHHDFFVNAYGGFSNLPQNDKSRVDEITNCIAMVVNEPPVTPQYTDAEIQNMQELEQTEIQKAYELGKEDNIKVLDKIRAEIMGMYRVILKGTFEDDWAVKWNQCLDEVLQIMGKYTAESEDK